MGIHSFPPLNVHVRVRVCVCSLVHAFMYLFDALQAYVADILTSMVKPFVDLSYVMCFYLSGYDTHTHTHMRAMMYMHALMMYVCVFALSPLAVCGCETWSLRT
jgi:hypothetical protein